VGDKLSVLGTQHCGKYGYGVFGVVVGADPKTGEEREEAIAIRNRYKNLFFLIPGFGAQGGAAEDAALLLRDGNGGVVNASRSILKAWTSGCNTAEADNAFVATAAREAVIAMRDAIRTALHG
jgi:orotidine-5'-phosphate decarboxylase